MASVWRQIARAAPQASRVKEFGVRGGSSCPVRAGQRPLEGLLGRLAGIRNPKAQETHERPPVVDQELGALVRQVLAADVRLAYTLSWAFSELVRISVTGGDRNICSIEHAMGKALCAPCFDCSLR